jgi:hypothetical protein
MVLAKVEPEPRAEEMPPSFVIRRLGEAIADPLEGLSKPGAR